MSFAQRLRTARLARGYNQRELAVKAGLSVAYVHRVERALDAGMEDDSIEHPGLDAMQKLAAALEMPDDGRLPVEVPIAWLVFGQGPEPAWPPLVPVAAVEGGNGPEAA